MIQKALPFTSNFSIYQAQPDQMDNRFSSSVIGAPVVSRELVLSKLAYQPIYTLPTSSKTNAADSKDSLAVSAKNRVSLGPKLIQIVKHKLSYGAKILPLGRKETIFSKNFNTTDCENLLHTARCSIYTTAGAIPGILFVSTERMGFCSARSLKTYSAAGEVLKFQYKVSIPLKKIKGVEESMNKYVELVTVDDFSFWFLGFPNSNKSLRYLLQAINRSRLSVH